MKSKFPTYNAEELRAMVKGIDEGLDAISATPETPHENLMDCYRSGYTVRIKGSKKASIDVTMGLARITNPTLVLQLAAQLLATMEPAE